MAYFADLSPCTYSPKGFLAAPLAVGWLDDKDYVRGEVSGERIRKLVAIHQDSPFLRDLHYRGMHPCPFCDLQGAIDTEFGSFHIGASNILVPTTAALYYSPSTILHYIIDHGYRPPEVYLQAVDEVDMTSFTFVDQVTRTLKLRSDPRDEYAERIGDLMATHLGLRSISGLQMVRSEIMNEELPPSASYPPRGLSEEAVARVEARLGPLREEARYAFATAIDVHEGTKWYPALQEYARWYETVRTPKANL